MTRISQLSFAGTPTSGTNAVKTLTTTGTPAGGTFTLTCNSQTTGAIVYNATAAQVKTALEALSHVGAGNVTCTGGPLPTGIVITFSGAEGIVSGKPVTMTSTDSLTGGSNPATAIDPTTTGVQGTYRTAMPGCTLIDTTNAKFYSNTGTSSTPTWTETTS